MPLWPFRRRSRRKRGRANTLDTDEYAGAAAGPGLPPRSQTAPVVAVPERHPSKKQRTEPKKLQRRGRAFSFSPDRHDSVRVASSRAQRGGAETSMSHAPSGYTWRVDHGARATPSGLDAVQDEMLWRVPTLHNKRGADQLPRKTSSKKRRKEDQEREAQIRAMCAFEPVRPATEDWMAGRPIKKESRRTRTGFGIGIKGSEFDKYNRSSDISLPLPGSIDSAASSDSEHISYKVSALEALAPRPTLRYSTNPRAGANPREGTTSRGPSQQRRKLTAPIPEETLRAHKRIDDLADDLSASDLRELMERDQRRRARKQQLEQEKQKRRIARRAEKQKAADAEAAKLGRQSPPNLERGVLGREDVGLGLDPVSAIVTSSRIRRSDEQPQQHARPDDDNAEPTRDPLAAFHRVDSHPLQPPEEPSKARQLERPVPILASPPSRTSFRRKLSRSKSPQESEPRTEPSELLNGPPGGSAKAQRSWTSIFKWGSKNKRHSGGPPSFSNTSRDSMPMAAPTPTPPINIIPRHVSSKLPKRTMSRFREDLPELPISPPTSRIQSPEDADAIYPFAPSTDLYPAPSSASRPRQGTVGSEQRSVEGTRETPSTTSHLDTPGVSPEPQAMSLASIDSEGSWFSGRLTSKKRKSSGILEQAPGLRLPRETPESDSERQNPEPDHTAEDMHITDDDYLSRLAPPQAERNAFNRKSTGEARPSSDWEEEEEAHWGSVRGRQPKVVRSEMVGRVKSREGQLNVFGEEGQAAVIETVEADADAAESSEHESSDGTAEAGGLQRATSVNLGHAHARRISAGSARLLSISPRSSVDAKGAVTLAEKRE